MNLEEFEDLVDRCGEQPADWPDDVRAEAVQFLAGSRQAQSIVAEAASLRAAFASSPQLKAPANLSDRIVALAERADSYQAPLVPDERPFVPGRSDQSALSDRLGLPKSSMWMALCFAVGLALGLTFGLISGSSTFDFATSFAIFNS
jgi:hypothetical protein